MTNPQEYRVESELDVAKVVMESFKLTEEIGFSKSICYLIATIISELGKNIIRYAGEGNIVLSIVEKESQKGIEVIAKDQGPGIEDVKKALTEHYSTTRSLGLGLPAVKRLMDELIIDSTVGKGTYIIARKWFTNGKN